MVLLLSMFACGKIHRPACVETGREDVADADTDVTTGSVDGLLAFAAGPHPTSGVYEDGTPVDLTVTLTRGEGSAQQVTWAEADEVTPGGLLGDVYETIAVTCDSPVLSVPVTVAVTTADAVVDFSVDVDATATGPHRLEYDATVDADVAVGLAGPVGTTTDGPCESGDAPSAAFSQGALDDDGGVDGTVGWEGVTTCTDGSDAAWARYTLSWP